MQGMMYNENIAIAIRKGAVSRREVKNGLQIRRDRRCLSFNPLVEQYVSFLVHNLFRIH